MDIYRSGSSVVPLLWMWRAVCSLLLGAMLQVLRRVTILIASTAAITTVSATAYLMTSHGDVTWSYINNMASKMAAFARRCPIKALLNVDWTKLIGISGVLLRKLKAELTSKSSIALSLVVTVTPLLFCSEYIRRLLILFSYYPRHPSHSERTLRSRIFNAYFEVAMLML